VKAIAKWTGVILAGLMLLGLLAWTGMFFFWQQKIRGCIRVLEAPYTSSQTHDAALSTLTSAGCRALPYIIASLDPAHADSELADAASVAFRWCGSKSGYSDDPEPQFQEHYRLLAECRLMWYQGPEDRRRRSGERLREWWSEWGSHYHSWWRVWTSSCRKGS